MTKHRMDRAAFKRIYERHANEDDVLSWEDVGDVFGKEVWMMLVYTMMDANDAARAIQGAIGRLKENDHVNKNDATAS